MLILLTPAQMTEMERRFFAETGAKSIDLMERAASEIVETILERFGGNRRVFFACGPGGNGGDGLAAARLYQEAGGKAAILLAEPPRSPDAKENYRRAREAGVEELSPNGDLETPDLWVDALFGTGLSRAVEGRAAEWIERIAGDGVPILAVDIPSGISGLSGQRLGWAIPATITVTFQCAKAGHFLNDGLDCTGELLVRDIGIPPRFLPENPAFLLAPGEISLPFPSSRRNIHKGSRGHALIVAGSLGMAGAAALAAGAALRSGAGLVTVACPQSIAPVLQILEPCAMALPLPEREGALSKEAVAPLQEAFSGKDAIAMGPGLSRRCAPEIVEAALESKLPAIFDADALNLLAQHPALLRKLDSRHTLTPHPGEARRLLGRELTDPLADAAALSELGNGCFAVLKGASRVIALSQGRKPPHPPSVRRLLSATGCAGMAKGGSGDVFTGVLAAFLSRYARQIRASWDTDERLRLLLGQDMLSHAAACEVHGLAGILARKKYGEAGMTAQNLVEMLPGAFLRMQGARESYLAEHPDAEPEPFVRAARERSARERAREDAR